MPEPTGRWFDRWMRQQEKNGQIATPEDRWRLAMLRDRVANTSSDSKPPRHELVQKCIWTNWALLVLICLHAAAMFDMGASGMGWAMLTLTVALPILAGYFIYIPVGLFQERGNLLPRDRAVCWASFVGIFVFAVLFVLVSGSPLPRFGLQWRLQQGNSVECIRAWALTVSQRPELADSTLARGLKRLKGPPGSPSLNGDPFAAIPPCILQLQPSYVDVHSISDTQQYVRITWGGGFGHYGVIAGAPTLQRDNSLNQSGWWYWMPGLFIFWE